MRRFIKKSISIILLSIFIISLFSALLGHSYAQNEAITGMKWNVVDSGTTYRVILSWDAFDRANYYSVSYTTDSGTVNKHVSGRNIFLTDDFRKIGTYTVKVSACDREGYFISATTVSPKLTILKDKYIIRCYNGTGGYQYYYDEQTEDFQLPVLEDNEQYTFAGWSGEGATKQKVIVISKGSTGDKTYVSNWNTRKFTISFDSQGGTSVDSIIKYYNSELGTLPSSQKEGYSFLGWFYNGRDVSSNTLVTKNMVLTARWARKTYSIKVYLKDFETGKVISGERIDYYIDSEDIILNNPIENGDFFLGWQTTGSEEISQEAVIPSGSTGDKTYYALYKNNPCKYSHSAQKLIQKATADENGKIYYICQNCGISLDKEYPPSTIYRPKEIDFYNDVKYYKYTGKPVRPYVSVLRTDNYHYGYFLGINSDCVDTGDFTITYSDNVNVGYGKVKIVFNDDYYQCELTQYFGIVPDPVKMNKIYPESGKFTAFWGLNNKQATGYQIQYSLTKDFKSADTKTIANSNTNKIVVNKLKNGKRYYVRVRCYKTTNRGNVYSKWSGVSSTVVNKASLNKTSVNTYRGGQVVLKMNNIAPNAKVKWASANKKIATVSAKGIVVGKKLGKTYVYCTYNGQKYKCLISVLHQSQAYYATLTGYNTRDNYFTIRFKNNTKKNFTIQKGTTLVTECDYKVFDRHVKLSNSYNVKPGKTIVLKFYVQGNLTWPDYSCFTLHYYFKFDDIKYYAKTDAGDSWYKSSKGWKKSYSARFEYACWAF